MKLLTIVVKPFRAEAVLKALAEMDVTSCVVREVKGFSRQKNYLDRYLGSEYTMAFLPKVEITACVSDERALEVEERIVSIARTGRMGDGKVFVLPMADPEALEF
jgi:nitrogen regulatory protein P-II 2